MLATLTTLVAMLAVVGLQLWTRSTVRNEGLVAVGRLMLFTASVSGVAALVMLAVTWHVRDDRPPMSIVVASVVIAAAPLITVAVLLLTPVKQ
jgi:hypothetical protein